MEPQNSQSAKKAWNLYHCGGYTSPGFDLQRSVHISKDAGISPIVQCVPGTEHPRRFAADTLSPKTRLPATLFAIYQT